MGKRREKGKKRRLRNEDDEIRKEERDMKREDQGTFSVAGSPLIFRIFDKFKFPVRFLP
jgi:hypothetical protein